MFSGRSFVLVEELGGLAFECLSLKDVEGPQTNCRSQKESFFFLLIFYLLLPPFRTTQCSGLTLASLLVTEIGREVIYHMLQRKIT